MPKQVLSRRGFVGATFGLGSALLLAACGAQTPVEPTAKPADAAKPAEAPKPTEAPKPAAADAAKPAADAAKPAAAVPIPTPTLPPVATLVPQASGTTKILLRVHWSGTFFNEFTKIINEYNSTQGPKDKIYVHLERWVAGQAGPIATFIADFQAGTQEDVYHLNQSNLADLAARDFFSPPPTEIQSYIKDHFLPAAVSNGTWQGKILGYPTENQPHAMYLNSKLFQEGGLDVAKDAPKKWDDIRRVAKQLTKKDAQGRKSQAGFIVHMGAGQLQFVQRLMFQFLSGEPLVDVSGTAPKVNVTSDAARAFTDLLAGLVADDSSSAGMGSEANTINPVWGQRRGAMITHDAYGVFFSLQSAGQPGVVEEQFTQGVYSRDGSKSGNLARNFHYLVSQKSKQKDLSWQFLRWMNDGPDYRMQNFQTHVFGFPPSVKNYDMPKFFPEQMKKAFNESMNTPNQTGLPVMRGLPEIYNIFRDNHDAMMNGSQTAADFTKKVDEETKKVLQSIYG